MHVESGLRSPCPRCGASLTRRADDNLDALADRLSEYRDQDRPVIIAYYQRERGSSAPSMATRSRRRRSSPILHCPEARFPSPPAQSAYHREFRSTDFESSMSIPIKNSPGDRKNAAFLPCRQPGAGAHRCADPAGVTTGEVDRAAAGFHARGEVPAAPS